MTDKPTFSIAIDGPAGAGKSTIAKLLAQRFGLEYVDTGAMYRGVGLLAIREGIESADEPALSRLAADVKFEFRVDPDSVELLNRVFVNGDEVTAEIREPDVSRMASRVSALSGVRRELVARQKQMGADGGVVMEGRDICGVVMPGAEVKIFLTASDTERARRRYLEMQQSGKTADFEEVLADIRERDHRDSTREDSPLAPQPGASIVDTDALDIPGVVDAIAAIVKEKT